MMQTRLTATNQVEVNARIIWIHTARPALQASSPATTDAMASPFEKVPLPCNPQSCQRRIHMRMAFSSVAYVHSTGKKKTTELGGSRLCSESSSSFSGRNS